MTKRLTLEDYVVGWICPLEVEQIAALEMLDEEHEALPKSHTDHNVYSLGGIAGHNVVIAGLYQPGNNPAATVVAQMRMTFPNLRFGLLVGIGGGVPVKTDNGMIRLGDVVVSKPTGVHSGAIQYDHGKAETGKFKRSGALAPPPAVLLSAAQDLASKRARSRTDVVAENIKRIDTTIRGLRRYKRPDLGQDHLYKAQYIHRRPNESCEECGCDPAQRIQRPNDDDDGEEPYVVVHRGTIASGELVVKKAVLRDELAEEHGVLCFETEAAGALADFPCLVIRGISDYCDSHKNDQWHGYAAAAAAGYARQLFFHMPIAEVRSWLSSFAEDEIHEVKQRQDDQDHQRMLEWLTPLDYGSQQSDYIKRRQPGTGKWLLNSVEFKQWSGQRQQTLFCPGIPGAGKTIMASIVIDHLWTTFQTDSTVGIAYVYCNFKRQDEQKPENLLSSILRQLAQKQNATVPDIKNLYTSYMHRGTTRPSFSELAKVLQSLALIYSRIFIVIDALDEYDVSREGFSRFLPELFNLQALTGLNLFVTSRFVARITSQFDGCIKKEIRAQDDDILNYVNGQIPQLLESQFPENSHVQDSIRTAVVRAADGMFLLAQLHMDSLKSQPTLGDIKEALENLPRGIEELDRTYKEAMERIESQRKHYCQLGKQVLCWITNARRALSTGELQHAVATRVGRTNLDKDFLPGVAILGSICAGLVTIDDQSDIIRLVHHTTQEYFEQTSWFPSAEMDIANICITYLSFDTFRSGYCQTDKEFEARLTENKLYDYAARNWGHHVRSTVIDEDQIDQTNQLVLKFLEIEPNIIASYQAMLVSNDSDGYSQKVPKYVTGAHLAGYFGLEGAIRALQDEDYYLDFKDTSGWTPLLWAARNGYAAVVQLLLTTENIDPDPKDDNGQTALSWAAENGHETIVKLLLGKGGVDPNTRDTYGQTPLWWALENGHEAIAITLLTSRKIDPNSKDGESSQTPLWWAIQNRQMNIVKLLLASKNINPNVRNDNGQSPLLWALENGDTAVTKQLLALENLDPNLKDNDGQTPMWWALENGDIAIFEQLIALESIDTNLKSKNRQTPVLWAINNGKDVFFRLLLASRSFNFNFRFKLNDISSWELLSCAAEKNQKVAVELLLEIGVNIEKRNKDGLTVLYSAVQDGRTAAVQLLLDNGANFQAENRIGETVLYQAVQGGNAAITQLLLNRGADIEAKDATGGTTLHLAAASGFEAIVELLLNKGADVKAKDITRGTALHQAAANGYESIVILLLKHGADIEAKDITGGTALQQAAEKKHKEVVQVLLENGADIEKISNRGELIFLWACEGGHEPIVRLLLDKGVCIDTKDLNGRSALSLAAENNHDSIILLLIEKGADTERNKLVGERFLQWAAVHGNEHIVQQLLRKGKDFDIKIDGTLLLYKAISNGHEAAAKSLLENGLDVDVDIKGVAMLYLAIQSGNEAMVKLLLDKGFDVNKTNRDRPMLYWAVDKFDIPMMQLLLDNGADVNIESQGETALSRAVEKRSMIMVRLLLEKGANVDASWGGHGTALHMAAVNADDNLVQLLLEHGADINIKDNTGFTALSLAAERGHKAVVRLLLIKGANYDKESNEWTALHTAATNGDDATMELLLQNGADIFNDN